MMFWVGLGIALTALIGIGLICLIVVVALSDLANDPNAHRRGTPPRDRKP